MTRNTLLDLLKEFTENVVKDIILPTAIQKVGEEQQYRCPNVYSMRLPDSKSWDKKAPYIIHQLLTTETVQPDGYQIQRTATVRTIISVYSEDEQEGARMLLQIADRFELELLRVGGVGEGNQFELKRNEPFEFLAYPDNTYPYYGGEMMTVWNMPPIRREIPEWP